MAHYCAVFDGLIISYYVLAASGFETGQTKIIAAWTISFSGGD